MKHPRAIAITLVAVVALVLAFVAGRETQSSGSVRDSALSAETASNASDRKSHVEESVPLGAAATPSMTYGVVPASSGELPLPPHDVPLVDALEELEAAARRGDRKAACRLAMDGQFCRANPVDLDSVAFFERSIAQQPRTTDTDIAWIAHLERIQQRARRICTGLPQGWAEDSSWRWMLQAARAGDAFLAAHFALSPPMDAGSFLERPEPWQQYRQYAAPLIEAAAANGQVEAIWFLQRLHRGGTQLRGMPNAIERNPRLAAVYAVALRTVSLGASLHEFEQALRQSEAEFDAEQWRAIQSEGEAMARRYFAEVAPRDFQGGVIGGTDSRRCE